MLSLLLLVIVVSGVSGEIQNEIAFSAGVTVSQTLKNAEKVAFDSIYTNIGSGFDTSSGNFNCPSSGIYVFEVYALATQDKTSWLELHHNNHYIFSIYAHQGNSFGSGGNTVILQLTKGDQVYVRAVHSNFGTSTSIYGKPDEVYSTFSGYLISPVYEDIPFIG